MILRLLAALLLVLTVAACGSGSPDVVAAPSPSPSPSPTAAASPSPSPEPAATVAMAARDACGESTDELIAALDTLLDRIDADPAIMLDGETDAMFEEFGALIGQDCSVREGGPALSEVFAFLADEMNRRSSAGSAFIEGLLGSLCEAAETSLADRGYELTSQGKLACLRS